MSHPSNLLSARRRHQTIAIVVVSALAACARERVATSAPRPAAATIETAPARLADTGLYADFARRTVAAGVLTFSPQYPLWTDGAAKQRWIALPPGTAIDASDVDLWCFPIGTRLWKEFAFERAVETRFMAKRADGSWLYATYLWNADASDAVLAPDCGVRGVCATADGQRHDVPSVVDCRLCHEGGRSPVLGFSALQLSPDRDPNAPHATAARASDVDLRSLAARGLLAGIDAHWLRNPPRIAAANATERAALGYLHGNCSSCHNATGPLARLGLRFDQPLGAPAPTPAIVSTVGVASQFTRGAATLRIAPGDPEHSVVALRLRATDALTQMPPFGRHLADRTAQALLTQWIHDLAPTPAALAGEAARSNPQPKER